MASPDSVDAIQLRSFRELERLDERKLRRRPARPAKKPGVVKTPYITPKRGVTGNTYLYHWARFKTPAIAPALRHHLTDRILVSRPNAAPARGTEFVIGLTPPLVAECAELSKPYRLFFSHGGDDTFIVKEFLRPKVESSGAEVFLDAGRVDYGDDFRETIFFELTRSDELLVLLTPSSIRRPWVTAEIGAMLVREKRVVAVRYGPSESELQELGILSLLGAKTLLRMEDLDEYVIQLGRRVIGRNNE